MNRRTTRIESNATDSGAQEENQEIEDRQTALFPVLKPLPGVEEEPENAAQAVREPVVTSVF